MLRGTRILIGPEAERFGDMAERARLFLGNEGLTEVIIPAIWESKTFLEKLGPEKEGQMWIFNDKGERECCLIPEVTGIIQEMWREEWSKRMQGLGLFYITRCYRYERPQAGRYREFTQIGVELLGRASDAEIKDLLIRTIRITAPEVPFDLLDNVQRGLAYYTQDGFEAVCHKLGAQKQIAGGGRYAEGVGFAIGLDRLLLASEEP